MKESHKVGDHFREFANYDDENGRFSRDEWLIWKIEGIDGRGRYTCICVEDAFVGGNTHVGTYVHFHWTNYREWFEHGSMEDYQVTHFEEDLFEL